MVREFAPPTTDPREMPTYQDIIEYEQSIDMARWSGPPDEGGVIQIPSDSTVEPILGARVFFITRSAVYPAIVVDYDPETERTDLQVFNKTSSGCSLVTSVPSSSLNGTYPYWSFTPERIHSR